ncbi:hypothetical protein BDK51DRAFT_38568 [Blyttiomyces helicus]|uniref:Uncharacterized protein n=1 Tax=Blyttiomyces helicus TaxID=388810 RepID=A0A4P9W1U8_9FUNG|nr:hypothetical protein BDK51DRAFT_38568 [Blyttiomyces helicus]|eukprot:RKO86169.1 hypothetical protein BDK51DRAFT_38568 [Blyttiomyces helicus]
MVLLLLLLLLSPVLAIDSFPVDDMVLPFPVDSPANSAHVVWTVGLRARAVAMLGVSAVGLVAVVGMMVAWVFFGKSIDQRLDSVLKTRLGNGFGFAGLVAPTSYTSTDPLDKPAPSDLPPSRRGSSQVVSRPTPAVAAEQDVPKYPKRGDSGISLAHPSSRALTPLPDPSPPPPPLPPAKPAEGLSPSVPRRDRPPHSHISVKPIMTSGLVAEPSQVNAAPVTPPPSPAPLPSGRRKLRHGRNHSVAVPPSPPTNEPSPPPKERKRDAAKGVQAAPAAAVPSAISNKKLSARTPPVSYSPPTPPSTPLPSPSPSERKLAPPHIAKISHSRSRSNPPLMKSPLTPPLTPTDDHLRAPIIDRFSASSSSAVEPTPVANAWSSGKNTQDQRAFLLRPTTSTTTTAPAPPPPPPLPTLRSSSSLPHLARHAAARHNLHLPRSAAPDTQWYSPFVSGLRIELDAPTPADPPRRHPIGHRYSASVSALSPLAKSSPAPTSTSSFLSSPSPFFAPLPPGIPIPAPRFDDPREPLGGEQFSLFDRRMTFNVRKD